ncbi:MAG: lipocalin-like domain-containing protein [Duncaniella sp.]|nr:lipocalin-like domain-containing protein [Duncaniella sp.]
MTRTLSLMLACIISLLLGTGCTHNDGDIGDLFGWWTLDSLTADGTPTPLTDDEVLLCTWAFQTSVIQIQETLDHAEARRYKGSWSREGDLLMLNFSYTDNAGGSYVPSERFHLLPGITPLTILKLDGSRMHLRYTHPDDGTVYDYYLSKPF